MANNSTQNESMKNISKGIIKATFATLSSVKPSILFFAFVEIRSMDMGTFKAQRKAVSKDFIAGITIKPLNVKTIQLQKKPYIQRKIILINRKPDKDTGVTFIAGKRWRSFSSSNKNESTKPGKTEFKRAKKPIISSE